MQTAILSVKTPTNANEIGPLEKDLHIIVRDTFIHEDWTKHPKGSV